jgi:D-3-phosphoglycerate dehydrogenase
VQPIRQTGLDILEGAGIRPILAPSTDPSTILEAVRQVDAVITRNSGLSAEAIAAAPRLKVIAVHGVGTNAVAVAAATARGIAVVNTPDVNARSVAEHAIALTLALAKAIPAADAATRAGDDSFKYSARLTEVAGLTFGIVGFGAIGKATAQLAKALGMRARAFSRSRPDSDFADAGIERAPNLPALLADSDVVSLHLPLVDETRGIIGPGELRLMKPGAFLINTGRGGLVDETALAEALEAGRLGGAGLDAFAIEPLPTTSPLVRLSNVILSPHIAGSTVQALERMADLSARQVVDVLSGRRPPHPVNPEVWAVRPMSVAEARR